MSSAGIRVQLAEQTKRMEELREGMMAIERDVTLCLHKAWCESVPELYAEYFRLGCEYFEVERKVKLLKSVL